MAIHPVPQKRIVTLSMSKPKQILFAHQSTIPHYRVEFYNCLQKLKSSDWEFTVVFDAKESERYFFKETDAAHFAFKVLHTKTYDIRFLRRKLKIQTFPLKIFRYDLIIVGSALDNISYPLVFLGKLLGKRIGIWGKGKDYEAEHKDVAENVSERFKIFLSKHADCFFAYTNGVKEFLISKGVKGTKVTAIQNTIDIEKQRACFELLKPERERLRLQYNLTNRKTLLFVGRLIRNKNIDFILRTFDCLYALDNSYKLILVGSGEKVIIDDIKSKYTNGDVVCKGFVPDEKIGEYFIFSDLYIYPGVVGLGPLQSLCYDLTPVLVHSEFHSPEYEYMNENNALILPAGVTAENYASAIHTLMCDSHRHNTYRLQAFPSIQHLTLENMAKNFISGINATLNN